MWVVLSGLQLLEDVFVESTKHSLSQARAAHLYLIIFWKHSQTSRDLFVLWARHRRNIYFWHPTNQLFEVKQDQPNPIVHI